MPAIGIFKKISNSIKNDGIGSTIKKAYYSLRFRIIVSARRFASKKNSANGNIGDRYLDDANIIPKNRHLYIFSSIPFYDIGGGQRSAQMARTFNDMGYSVHYYYCADANESVVYNIELPTVEHKHIKDCDPSIFEAKITDKSIVIVELPHKDFLPYIKIANSKRAKIIYENIDNWESSLGEQFFSKDILESFLRYSDLFVGTASSLVKQLSKYLKNLNIDKKVIYCPNAVNDMLFNPQINYDLPSDFVGGEKTLIYYGSLWGDWFDWELIFNIAKERPNDSILLIGEKENIQNIVKKAPKNIHFLGIKKQSDLPAYLKYSDYALIPFKVDKIGESVSPLKVFEYISMNKIVLSTNLPELKGYPNTFCSNDSREWIKEINSPSVVFNNTNRDDFIEKNNWHSRCSQLITAVDDNSEKEKITIVINYNNDPAKYINSIKKHSKNYNIRILSSLKELKDNQLKNQHLLILNAPFSIKNDNWLDSFISISDSFDIVHYDERLDIYPNALGKKAPTSQAKAVFFSTNYLNKHSVKEITDPSNWKTGAVVSSPYLGISSLDK